MTPVTIGITSIMSLYPDGIDRMSYNKIVGALRVNNIVAIITELGSTAQSNAVEKDDVDIRVYDNDENLVLVIEVTNWRLTSYMSEKKAKSVQKNFRKYSCHKLFICSFEENYAKAIDYFDDDVTIIQLQHQTQPRSWYDWFREQNRADGMRPDCEETKQHLEASLLDYFIRKGIVSPSFS